MSSCDEGQGLGDIKVEVVNEVVPKVTVHTQTADPTEHADPADHAGSAGSAKDDVTVPCIASPSASTSAESLTASQLALRDNNDNLELDANCTTIGKSKRSSSSQSTRSSACSSRSACGDMCRICHCDGTNEYPLITPCYCSGSLKFVHQKCLQQWIKSSQTRSCEVCRFAFNMQTKLKPFRKWEKLDMSSVERRKILCSVTFHIIAITCVVWSLYVLIERTSDEIKQKSLDWPFWTKLVVVAIGFTGGLVFMYVQCKMYIQLFRRWKAYNKVIYVQNCPEGLLILKMRDNTSQVMKMKVQSPS